MGEPKQEVEAVLDENLNPDVKKKKKKNKENNEEVEKVNTETTDDEPNKKKKKKKEKSGGDEPEDKDSDDSGTEESGPFKKKFYTMTAKTEGRAKADTKEYQSENNITMFGKGRKKYKPLLNFDELGLPDSIMKICSGLSQAQGGVRGKSQSRFPQDADRVPHQGAGNAEPGGVGCCRSQLWGQKCVCIWRCSQVDTEASS